MPVPQQPGSGGLGFVVIGKTISTHNIHNPMFLKLLEPWANDHRRRWNYDALEKYGERVIIRQRWNVTDFANGLVGRCTVCAPGKQVSALQKINAVAESGTFTLSFKGQTTAAIPFNSVAADIQALLGPISTIGVGNVSVRGGPADTDPFYVEFAGVLGGSKQPLVELGIGNLVNVPSPSVEEILSGSDQQRRIGEVYKQAGDSYCASCYGVGFENGYQPVVYITYVLISDKQHDTTRTTSGVFQRIDPMVEFPPFPQLEEHDLMVRVSSWGDGVEGEEPLFPIIEEDRFEIGASNVTTLRTGPGTPNKDMSIGQSAQIKAVPFTHPLSEVQVIPDELDVFGEPDPDVIDTPGGGGRGI